MKKPKAILATETLPRKEGEYANRLSLIEWGLQKDKYSTHIECFRDDDKDEKKNKPFYIYGRFYKSFDEALEGFLDRKEDSYDYKDLKVLYVGGD